MGKVLDIIIEHKATKAEWKLSGLCPECGGKAPGGHKKRCIKYNSLEDIRRKLQEMEKR